MNTSTSTASILRKFLMDRGIIQSHNATGVGVWRSYLGVMPDEPDNCVAVIDQPSRKDGRIMFTGEVIDHPGVQIIVRAQNYPLGWDRAKQIEFALDTILRNPVTMGVGSASVDYLLQSVTRTTSVNPLGADPASDQKREFFSLNVFVTVNQT